MGAAELAVAIVAAAAGAGVTVLVRTGWLQSRTLEKCIGLSVVLHLVIAVVAAFVGGWSPASWGQRDEGRMTMLVVLADDQADDAVADAADAIGDPDDGPPDPPTASSEAATAEAPPLPSLATAESPPAPPGPVLDRAVRYTLAMQHPITGGWRYAAGDRGDTSQLGWQVMALAAAKNAGLSGFESAEARAGSFLTGVSSGTAGGLVSYRPGERASLAMTAEALFCRLLMGMPADHPAAVEACGVLSQSLPSRDTYNIYTWYYGTLASFHAGGPQWDAWNRRLQTALLPLQHRSAGHLAGSWDPDGLWGRHGGRVYATALAALTLEVYYRYLPLHDHSARMAARP